MTVYRTYKGGRLDLQHYKGKSIVNYEFTVTCPEGLVYFDDYVQIELRMFQKLHGTSVFTTLLDVSSPADVLLWNQDKESMDLLQKPYYHECVGVYASGEEDILFHGVSLIL